MPRMPRIIIPDVPYHVTQRGNHQIDVFYNPNDRKRYLELLALYSSVYQFDILAYCLMTNHVHLVGIPRKEDSIARVMQVVQVQHAQRINRQKGWTGNLWHQRYFACALDEKRLWLAIRYVEQNPVRAGIVSKAEDYIWSSAAFHCGSRKDSIISHDNETRSMFDGWSRIVNQVVEKNEVDVIRYRTYKGLPCGDEQFVKRISTTSGGRVVDRGRGRPRNAHK